MLTISIAPQTNTAATGCSSHYNAYVQVLPRKSIYFFVFGFSGSVDSVASSMDWPTSQNASLRKERAKFHNWSSGRLFEL